MKIFQYNSILNSLFLLTSENGCAGHEEQDNLTPHPLYPVI